MHILAFTDQHAQSLGGVQVSLRLQRKFLQRLGHEFTIVAPRLHRSHERDEHDISLPSWPITKDREYSASWPGRRAVQRVIAALEGRKPVDVIHIQGDFWGALLGYRVARILDVPVVHTMHNNVDKGTRAVTPLAPVLFAGLNVWRRMLLGPAHSRQRGAWKYLHALAKNATVVTAPSQHFSRELIRHGVAASVAVTPTGVDDDVVDVTLAALEKKREPHSEPTFVWLGRMSHEKRILQLLKAITLAGVDARFELYGSGLLRDEVSAFIRSNALEGKVVQRGAVSYEDALLAIAKADALIQTSVGFETQGMTVFEASALGTPSVLSDPNIADDLDAAVCWRVADTSVIALAEAIRAAALDLSHDRLRIPNDDANRFRQSVQTARIVDVYESSITMTSVKH
jgi:1,2-diacylglycerol 3-alpha-glucosyltransferase